MMNPLRSRPTARLAVLGIALSCAGVRSALAEPHHSPVVVELRRCDELLDAEVRRIVGVELRAAIVDATGARGPVTRVVAVCRGSHVVLSLEDATAAKHLERTLALAEAAPASRARLVALAVAELVVASGQEVQSDPNTTPQPPTPRPRPPTAPAAAGAGIEPGPTRAAAAAIGVVRAFPGSNLWLLGGGARGSFALSRPLTLLVEVTAEWGKTSRATGKVAARSLGGALGLGWSVEGAWVSILPWLGARAGAARLTGEPTPGSQTSAASQSGPWLGPEVGIAAAVFPHAAVHATVALSGGAMLLGVRGDVARDSGVSVRGPWAALVLGVGAARP